MRIEKLNENTKKNLLDDLLKRSPNNYGKFEASVQEILNAVKEKGDEAVFEYTEKFDGVRHGRRASSCNGRRDRRSI